MNTTDPSTDTADLEARLRGALRADAERYEADADLRDRIDRRVAPPRRTVPFLLAAAAAIVVVLVLGTFAIRREDAKMIDTGPASGTPVPATTPTTTGGTTPTTSTASPSVATAPAPGLGTTAAPTPTATSTPATPTTAATGPTTTGPPNDPTGVLRIDGVGGVDFGGPVADAEAVITALAGKEVGRYTTSRCDTRTFTTWGSFALESVDGRVVGWELLGDPNLGLHVDTGVHIGSTADDVRSLVPGVEIGHDALNDRDGAFLQAPDGKWGALLDGDRVVAMHAITDGPATSGLMERCAGPWAFELPLHLHGLGAVYLWTPEARAVAALDALYGAPTEVRATCDGDLRVYAHHGATASVWLRMGMVVLFSERPAPGEPVSVWVPAGLIRTGMTRAELRAMLGVELATPLDPPGTFRYQWGDPDEVMQSPWIAGEYQGEGDAAVLVSLGEFSAGSAC